ncbi:hypothetical protein FGIG_11375 [Fasciola gigantica]|uniref:Uncharacterized protein n=1 Tax=Fasciola gigantica TaxID=46835 RepID=A0A504YT01_FASGI|nr:hypothetical protein FGIG_11375 [Fasciola gigantica]
MRAIQAHPGRSAGSTTEDDGWQTPTSDFFEEVLKHNFDRAHVADSGEYINRIPYQETTQVVDCLVRADQVGETTRILSASKTAESDSLHSAIIYPLEEIMAETKTRLFNIFLETVTLS